ncbi:pyridine nucleotide-disulfide oxidoreductase [Gammaproteobacteria bacterium]|nr:pyridine nucleotide-disulfide oxidoreductase [Gammaproteobacteria bacterium]
MIFKLPNRIDPQNLVGHQTVQLAGISVKASPNDGAHPLRRRDGFSLTDKRMSAIMVAREVNYCKYCHDHDGDFCSKGFPVKKGEPELGFKAGPFGHALIGCPLEEKISEMQRLQKEGLTLGALAMIMIENPMVPATGHRICNDCMKACIYQKQDPVDIPQIETRVLTDVLDLPWGVEIYNLLTLWNPLKQTNYLPSAQNKRKVMIAGLGPAGFTMAHYLSHAGCLVVGVDGLKLEPLPAHLLEQPIKDWSTLEESLDERILAGFGGVAEYGITVRWDKNFLKLIYLTLARRDNIQLFGGVRLGGTLTLDDAFELGFDHVSMAVGAGLPRVLNIENSLARGMRQASDFLMAMQLTGAAKSSSLANLQIRLPAVVIGGGLTAIDTATELQAYYIKQVEKIQQRVHILGEAALRIGLSPEDDETLSEFLEHAAEVTAERLRAKAAHELPNFVPLLHKWGGVLLAYRKTMEQSPAYTLNHEEIIKAFEEGIFYGEGLDPQGVSLDKYGHIESIEFKKDALDISIPARAVLVAAGTVPNTIYATEYPERLLREGTHFQGFDEHGEPIVLEKTAHAKSDFAAFTSFKHAQNDPRRVSYIGDTHPVFNGNVVKAITSAKRAADKILASFKDLADNILDNQDFKNKLHTGLIATIESINSDNPAMTEIWIKAPFAAKNFQAGQFFRMQTFEQNSEIVAGTRLQIPLLTVSGTGVKDDCIRLMVLQWGTGPRLVSRLKQGDAVILAGPTGAPTYLPKDKTILVIAGRWGAAVMLDIGHALRSSGNKVIYLAAFEKAADVDHIDELEAGADMIIWCTQKGAKIPARRPQDLSIEAVDMIALLQDLHKNNQLDTLKIDRLMAMGSTGLLKGLQTELSKGGRLFDQFKPDLEMTGTVGSPMQCMMKGVCGQCLQWQIDPETGKRTKAVFSCAGQDQPLKEIDLDNLAARTSQNRLQERISAQWLTHVLGEL